MKYYLINEITENVWECETEELAITTALDHISADSDNNLEDYYVIKGERFRIDPPVDSHKLVREDSND